MSIFLVLVLLFGFGCKNQIEEQGLPSGGEEEPEGKTVVEFDQLVGFSGFQPTRICVTAVGTRLAPSALIVNNEAVLPIGFDGNQFYFEMPTDLEPGFERLALWNPYGPLFPTGDFEVLELSETMFSTGGGPADWDSTQPTNAVDLLVSLYDENGDLVPLVGIEVDDFELTEVRFRRIDGTPLCGLETDAVAVSISATPAPATGLAVDTSGSMGNVNVALAREAARRFGEVYLIPGLGTPNLISLYSFQSGTTRHIGYTEFLADYQDAVDDIPNSTGGTRLYDTMIDMIGDVVAEEPGRTKIQVVMTDGFDGTATTADQVIDEANNNDVRVFTVGLGVNVDRESLERIATETGGAFLTVEDAEDLEAAFERIAMGLAFEFSLGVDVTTPDLEPGEYILTAILSETHGDPANPTRIPVMARVVIDAP